MSDTLRAAIFLDFDNIVSGMAMLAGPELAERFAADPRAWLRPLMDGPRRTLLRRCYMNANAYIKREDQSRAYFGDFRFAFQAAGFEVVDCPPLTQLKNGADIRMTVDVMDALASTTRFDEFNLHSSDSDFVPLLLRLRAADRRTRMVAHPRIGAIVRAAADEVHTLDDVAKWLLAEGRHPGEAVSDQVVLDTVGAIMTDARGPITLASLGSQLASRLGLTMRDSNYAGRGSVDAMLDAVGGLARQEGPGGGFVLRGEWLASPSDASTDPTDSASSGI
ncbi:MAG: NYN domain-containing protein [Rubritepida sp.]|nr:NYN domain-containing protein [Rubritepida sp.]